MRRQKYEFDKRSFDVRESSKVKEILGYVVRYMAYGLALLVVGYLLVSLFVSTDTEKRLRRENRMYAKVFPDLEPKRALLEDAITMLEAKDDSIYGYVFHSTAPGVDPVNSLESLHGADTLDESRFVSYTYSKACNLEARSHHVEENFRNIVSLLSAAPDAVPPMTMPVGRISYSQMGAGVGTKINPFLKAPVQHNGLDIIVPQGSPVYASAAGFVSDVIKSNKGQGNVIEVTHSGGYTTRYAHLSAISVREGQKVAKGQKIGAVGMSGQAYAPHLHYEVRLAGSPLDPVSCLFASLSPQEYADMLYVAEHTEQSLD